MLELPSPRRVPARIALELLDCIDGKDGRASKWDLIKVVGTEAQFHYWVEEFLLKDKFIQEQLEAKHYFYKKTETGELLQKLLKNGRMMHALARVSGKKLRY